MSALLLIGCGILALASGGGDPPDERRLTCVWKVLDLEAARRAEGWGVRIPVYRCERILFDGRDVTKFIKGVYRHGLREIWLTPYADLDVLRHEVAHAIFCRRHPEWCERLERAKPEERPAIRAEIERRIREIEKSLSLSS